MHFEAEDFHSRANQDLAGRTGDLTVIDSDRIGAGVDLQLEIALDVNSGNPNGTGPNRRVGGEVITANTGTATDGNGIKSAQVHVAVKVEIETAGGPAHFKAALNAEGVGDHQAATDQNAGGKSWQSFVLESGNRASLRIHIDCADDGGRAGGVEVEREHAGEIHADSRNSPVNGDAERTRSAACANLEVTGDTRGSERSQNNRGSDKHVDLCRGDLKTEFAVQIHEIDQSHFAGAHGNDVRGRSTAAAAQQRRSGGDGEGGNAGQRLRRFWHGVGDFLAGCVHGHIQCGCDFQARQIDAGVALDAEGKVRVMPVEQSGNAQ